MPVNCTDQLQSIDICVNIPANHTNFQGVVAAQLEDDTQLVNTQQVDMRLKPLEVFCANPSFIVNSFSAAGSLTPYPLCSIRCNKFYIHVGINM